MSDKNDKLEHPSNFRWIVDKEQKGKRQFTFDGKEVFNLFQDYPHKLTKEQKAIFDAENPYWADFFKDRT